MKKTLIVLLFFLTFLGGKATVSARPIEGIGIDSCPPPTITVVGAESEYILKNDSIESDRDFEYYIRTTTTYRKKVFYENYGLCSSYTYTYTVDTLSEPRNIKDLNNYSWYYDTYSFRYNSEKVNQEYGLDLFFGDILIIEDKDGIFYGIDKYTHYDLRSELNAELTLSVEEIKDECIKKTASSSRLHRMPSKNNTYSTANIDNIKYICNKTDNYSYSNANEAAFGGLIDDKGSYEVIINSAGEIVYEDINMGTFNFRDSKLTNSTQHRIYDVLPWLVFGNSEDDYSRSKERFYWYENDTSYLPRRSGTYFDYALENGVPYTETTCFLGICITKDRIETYNDIAINFVKIDALVK